ncbi:MAG: type II secretion system GspH family protein [bacterium]|nr:type II secretion system GspH family protein [bacterium]
MIKRGFTLAEVLVTLGIIGVLATLTIPALMSNYQKEQIATSLVKAISAMEIANSIMIVQNEMYGIRENCLGLQDEEDIANATTKYEDKCFEPHIMSKLGAAKIDKNVTYNNADLNGTETIDYTSQYIYQNKNNIAYIFPGNNFGKYIRLWIDVNGIEKKPNQKAKDLFEVYIDIDNEGTILPVGSKRFAADPDLGGESWETSGKCSKTDDFTTMDWTYCSGSIVDNSGKVIYKWN